MKKTTILLILTILLGGMVSATTKDSTMGEYCSYVKICLQHRNSNICDFTGDGIVDLSDIAYFAPYSTDENFCKNVMFPPIKVTNTYVSGGSGGMSDYSFWDRLTGEGKLNELFDNFVDYLKTIFVTKDELKEYNYYNEERYCKDNYKNFPKKHNQCLKDAIDKIYGEGCAWEWQEGEKVMVCP
jgi:hypothetical protein